MADVTVKRTEDFESTFAGRMLKARAGLGVSSFGMQILRLPPNATAIPSTTTPRAARRRSTSCSRARRRCSAGGEEHALEPGVFARVGAERDPQAASPATSRAVVLALGGVPARRSSRPSTPTRASRTRSMADVTVKRLEDFEAIFRGGFHRVRAGLGVSSFGIAVMDFPPELRRLPRARPGPRPPGGGLHGAPRPGDADRRRRGARARARESGCGSARRRSARSSPATSRRGCSRSAAPRAGLRAARVHRGGRPRPARDKHSH